jgi:SAM-dependent methyltransferase
VELQESLDNLLSGVLDHLLETAGVEPRQSVLDIGCGTGASVLALCERVGPDGMVEGLDISSQMLARARQRAQDAGLRNARLTLADAQVHPFERQLYDQVVSRFGVMFFSDTVAAFANIANAVKPGGRMTLASWGPLQENPWFSIPRAAAIAQLGEVPPVDPNAPGPMAFHDTERVLGMYHFIRRVMPVPRQQSPPTSALRHEYCGKRVELRMMRGQSRTGWRWNLKNTLRRRVCWCRRN